LSVVEARRGSDARPRKPARRIQTLDPGASNSLAMPAQHGLKPLRAMAMARSLEPERRLAVTLSTASGHAS